MYKCQSCDRNVYFDTQGHRFDFWVTSKIFFLKDGTLSLVHWS